MEELEQGYYWVILEPVFENNWTIAFWDEDSFILLGLDEDYDKNTEEVVGLVGKRILEPIYDNFLN